MHISNVFMIGLISVIVCSGFIKELALSTKASTNFSVEYPGTQHVCEGDSAYAAIKMSITEDILPKDIKIMVEGQQFSEGAHVSGQFHSGDNRIDRWTNKLSFQGNQVMYEIWNSRTEYKDEFYCYFEINSGEEKFESEYFRWFFVENCTSQTKPADSTPGTPQPSQADIMEQLKQMAAVQNATESATVELRKHNAELKEELKLTNEHLHSIESAMEELCKQNDYQYKVLVGCIIIAILSNSTALLRMIYQYLKDKFPRYFSGNSSSPADGHPLSNISGGAEGRSSDQEAPQPAGSLHSLLSPEEEQNDVV